jgi:hypothetical protein
MVQEEQTVRVDDDLVAPLARCAFSVVPTAE